MKKISVVGSPGAGKSTFSDNLSNLIDVNVIHMDKLFWKPGWVNISREELMEKVKEVLKKDKWIIDGNYQNTLEQRFLESDTIIF
jgi:adenylate kinase family enzyme